MDWRGYVAPRPSGRATLRGRRRPGRASPWLCASIGVRAARAERRLPAVLSWTLEHSYPYTVTFLIVMAVVGVLVYRKAATEFEWAFVRTAVHFLAGRGIYELKVAPFRSFTYPPVNALLTTPLALLPAGLGRMAWFLVTAGGLPVVWAVSWRLSGGRPLQGAILRTRLREHLVAWLGLALAAPIVLSGLDHQQTDLPVAALLMLGALALHRSRPLPAAALFGLAAGIKCTPLLWGPYLAAKGRWKAAILVGVVAVGVNLAPDLVRGHPGGGLWMSEWVRTFLGPMARSDNMPGRWYAWVLDNQSLAGAVGRWNTTRPEWTGRSLEIVGRPSPLLSAPTARRLVFGIELALLGLTARALRRRPSVPRSSADAFEFGAVFCLMLLLSPMSGRPHFAILTLPALTLARRAVYGRDRASRLILAFALVAALVTAPLGSQAVVRLAAWTGGLTLCTVLLWLGCLLAMLSKAREEVGSLAEASRFALSRPHTGAAGRRAGRANSPARSVDGLAGD